MERMLPIALAVLLGLVLTNAWAQNPDDKNRQSKTEVSAQIQSSDLDQLQKQTEEVNFAITSDMTNAVQRKLSDGDPAQEHHCLQKSIQ